MLRLAAVGPKFISYIWETLALESTFTFFETGNGYVWWFLTCAVRGRVRRHRPQVLEWFCELHFFMFEWRNAFFSVLFFWTVAGKNIFLLRSKFFSKQDCQGSKEQSLLKQNNPNLIQNCWLFNFRLHPLVRRRLRGGLEEEEEEVMM